MIAKEGYSTILVVFLFSFFITIGTSYAPDWLGYIIYPLLVILCGLILYFFRDPKRNPPQNNALILSPADGRVVLIQEIEENEYMGGTATQISIFLSPLDVHVNRVPVSGNLEFVKYYPGKYLMAWEDHASEMNERAHFGVKHNSGLKILFKQITGFMARRIVYHLKVGENVQAGQRFGIMKFGSRMDVILPDDVEIKVKKGDRTVAGESILAEIMQ